MSSNIYDLLSNDEAHSKRPQEKELPGKPDKSDQRRSAPRGGAAAGRGGASAAGESRPQSSRARVDDRDRRGGRGGSRGGRGGRGGYHGTESDGVHRNFDRKQGEHTRHAPGEARKHGAVGEVDPTHFAGSASEFAAQDAAQVAESNADIVADEIRQKTYTNSAMRVCMSRLYRLHFFSSALSFLSLSLSLQSTSPRCQPIRMMRS